MPEPAEAVDPVEPTEGHPRKVPLVRVGDAFDLLGELDADSVDLFCTSPPYWGLRTYGFEMPDDLVERWKAARGKGSPPWIWYKENGGILGMEPYPEWYVDHLVEILRIARGALKRAGSLWLNLGDTYFARWSSIRADGRQGLGDSKRSRRRTPSGGYLIDKQLLLIPSRVAIALQADGWILRNDLIWSKPAVPPRPESDRLRASHEHFFHFVRRNPRGRASYHYDLSKAEQGGLDVVSCSVGTGRGIHSATFPEELIRPRIESSSPLRGFVVDPFCGTGTTLIAAIKAGRLAQGFELSPTYAQTARSNVRQAKLAASQIAGAEG